jgi:hypothetical protein
MRKELIWVGIIGILFGLIIGFGSWRVRSSLKPKDNVKPSPTPQIIGQSKITLDKPENGDVITESLIAVSGITKPLTWVVFSGEKGDYTIQSDESGLFSQVVDLISGINQIKVTSFDAEGNQVSQKVLVVYSSSFQLELAASPTSSTATGESDINKKVAQKVAQASNRPKAYIGTVTDISDSTIQIKTTDSQIEQIAIGGSGITVVNTKGTNNKALKLTDIAIGDFIVAMGYINGNQVLKAQRILVTDAITDLQIEVSIAKVSSAPKKSLSAASLKDNQALTITPDKNTDIVSPLGGKTKDIKLSDIIMNDLVIFVLDTSTNTPLVRSIFNIGQV